MWSLRAIEMKKQKPERIYLICPVRNVSSHEKKFIDDYVMLLERQGNKTHYPPRDVRQDDATGVDIVNSHRDAMKWCDSVHTYWNPESEGSVFDLGMLVMAKKPIKIINKKEVEQWLETHPGKSFTRVAYELSERS